MEKEKRVSDSYTEQVQLLTQSALNGYNRLFGGQLMEWIDVVAAVVARRHCEKNVTTAFIDSLDFKAAAYANDTLVLSGKLVYVGRTSMEICVKTYVEDLCGEKRLINSACVVMVALDEDERPTPVPKLILSNEEEERDYEAALLRRKMRDELRAKKKEMKTNIGKCDLRKGDRQ